MMKNRCLYCYEPIQNGQNFHAKCSKSFFGTSIPPVIPYSLSQMDELAKDVVTQRVAVPGVQPKLSMSLVKETNRNSNYRLTVIGALGGNYIFKPPSKSFQEMPGNEHLTMRIAQAFGIRVVSCSLIRLASGELSYITKREDRALNGQKIHMLDMFQINEAFIKHKSSMEKVGKALGQYSDNPLLDKIFYFELALFSFLVGNNDMHLKNFSMIQRSVGWVMAPAYDLLNVAIVLPEDKEELALSVSGKKRNLVRVNFEQFALGMGLTDKQVKGVFNRMIKNKPKAINWIEKSFLSQSMKNAYQNLLESRYAQLNL